MRERSSLDCAHAAVAEHKSFTKAAQQLGIFHRCLPSRSKSWRPAWTSTCSIARRAIVSLKRNGRALLVPSKPVLDDWTPPLESANAFRDRPCRSNPRRTFPEVRIAISWEGALIHRVPAALVGPQYSATGTKAISHPS